MESNVEVNTILFISYLEARQWDIHNILIEGGKIYSIDIQWNGLICATHKENGQKMLFLIDSERSEIKDSYEYGIKTFKYLQQLKNPLPKDKIYSERERSQQNTFKSLANYNITIVHATKFISNMIKEQVKKTRDENINFWIMEYPEFASSPLSIMIDNNGTIDKFYSWKDEKSESD
jgi:vacuolar-type H+-ATPase subunit F/Vma7